MDFQIWLTFVAASTALLLIPGPAVLLVLSYAVSQGQRVALATVAWVVVGDLVAMTASLAALVVFDGLATRLPARDAGLYPFVFQRISEPVCVISAARCPAMVCLQTLAALRLATQETERFWARAIFWPMSKQTCAFT